MAQPLLTRACRREAVERTPVWFMRQAGRSLPEYREIRERHSLFEVCRQPDLCAEVTLQPVRAHGVDAAVMFADIMLPVLGMGIDVELVENVGPMIERPITTMADVERLAVPDPDDSVPFILEAVELVLADLARAGGDVIGLDWRIPIARGWALVGEERGVQGNLEPALLLGPWERVEAAATSILTAVAGRRGHVFNLGHGVLPATDPADLRRLAELVHERTAVEVWA